MLLWFQFISLFTSVLVSDCWHLCPSSELQWSHDKNGAASLTQRRGLHDNDSITSTCIRECVCACARTCQCQTAAEICFGTKMTFTASERNCSSRLTMKKASENARACVAHLSEHGATWLSSSARGAAGTQWISGSAQVNCKPSMSYFYAVRTPEDVKHAKQRNTWVYFGWAAFWKVIESCGISILAALCYINCFKFSKGRGQIPIFFRVQQLLIGHGVVIERPECCDFSLPFLCFWQVAFVCSCQDTGKSLLSLKRCYFSFWLIWLHCGS